MEPAVRGKRPRETKMRTNWIVMVAMAATEAWGEETRSSRRVVISIPDRKAALIAEDGSIVKVYPVGVGARRSPSNQGRV